MNRYYVNNRKPLPETAFSFLPLGSVKPKGWLKEQLRIQADGQAAQLPIHWDSLGSNSGWLGGTGESWERGPYYLDGQLPLAFLLEDQNMIEQVMKWIEWMLDSQDELGHFGPASLDDWWPFGVALKVLTQYHEVSGDKRVIPLMERFFKYMKNQLPARHLYVWAKVRWADTVLSVIWLYNRNGDPELLELADMIERQGFDWSYNFADYNNTVKQTGTYRMRTHVVNNAMALKAPAVAWEVLGWDEHKHGAWQGIQKLDEYHGTAVGVFTGDEHIAGKNPTQGTEVCAVVEYMFSLENLMQIFGDPAFGDRLEKITYNALPGTFDEKMMAHQYDQQANQVLCTDAPRHYTNNRADSNCFGLEPQYGCCTANYHQGWPKFAANLWMATPDNGLAAVAYGPCEVKGKVGNERYVREATINVETNYPFDETIKATIHIAEPTKFPIKFRIPAWAEGATVSVNGESEPTEPGTFKNIDREWSEGDVVTLNFPMKVETERRYNNSITIKRGPLVYSLKIGERWERFRGEDWCPDYAVYPTTPWNYGLVIDPENPEVEVIKNQVTDSNWAPDKAPIELKVKGKRVPQWQMEDNQAGELPVSPVKSSEPVEELTLIPYGCAKLRITEFPLIEE